MSSFVSVGAEGVDRVPLAGMYSGLLLLRSLRTYDGGGVLTTLEEMSWYMVLWSDGCEGSCTRPAPQVLTAPERKVKRMERCFEMPWRVRMR